MNKVLLELDGKTYVLAGVSLNSYNRNTENEPYPGDNTLVIQMKSNKVDQNLLDWFYNKLAIKKNGKITFFKEDDLAVFSISFTEAYSYSFNANMYAQDNYGTELSITLAAKSMTCDAITSSAPGKPQI